MHPDTELYMHELRTRRDRDWACWRVEASYGAGSKSARLLQRHDRDTGALYLAHLRELERQRFLRSLRDWPQPGRPA